MNASADKHLSCVQPCSDARLSLQESFGDKYSDRTQGVLLSVVRIALVLFIALVAAGVPGFGLFISLIGSLACASLSFIVPALCHLILFKRDLNW